MQVPLLRVPADLDDPGLSAEQAFRVEGAFVAYADYALLQRDFSFLQEAAILQRRPEVSRLHGAARAAAIRDFIDGWLTRNAAVMSEPHRHDNAIHAAVRSGAAVTAYRPTRYGRALVVSVEDGGGLLDLKGAGVAPSREPRPMSHASGVCELGKALQDLLLQMLIDEIFRRAAPHFTTVPVYGVLDLGFDVRDESGDLRRAAIHIRRAHRRPMWAIEIPAVGSPEERVKAQVETLLRMYGLTSSNDNTVYRLTLEANKLHIDYGGQNLSGVSAEEARLIRTLARLDARNDTIEIDAVNVQLTREVSTRPVRGTLVDFGHYRLATRFVRPVVNLVRGRVLRWGGILWPSDPLFVQPHPGLQISVADWGLAAQTDDDALFAIRAEMDRLVEKIRTRQIGAKEVRETLRGYVARSIARWRAAG